MCPTQIRSNRNDVPQVDRFERAVAYTSGVIYPAWGLITACREAQIAASLLFRQGRAASLLARLSQIGLGASTVIAVVEMGMMGAVFGVHAHGHVKRRAAMSLHDDDHARFLRHIDAERSRARGEVPDGAAAAILQDGAELVPLLGGKAEQPEEAPDIASLAASYAAYREAAEGLPADTAALQEKGLAMVRDTGMQGGAVGCNLALLWQGFHLSQWLHIAAQPIVVPVTMAVGGGFNIACGVLHLAAGAIGLWRGKARAAMSQRYGQALLRTVGKLEAHRVRAEEDGRDVSGAVPVCQALLHHAGTSKGRMLREAQAQQFMSRIRLLFGAAFTSASVVSLVLLLTLGTVGPGLGVTAMFALAAALVWLYMASLRSRDRVVAMQTPPEADLTAPMSLAAAIDGVIRLVDVPAGTPREHADARKLAKLALREFGVTSQEFRVLKWAPAKGRDVVRSDLARRVEWLIANGGAEAAARPAQR